MAYRLYFNLTCHIRVTKLQACKYTYVIGIEQRLQCIRKDKGMPALVKWLMLMYIISHVTISYYMPAMLDHMTLFCNYFNLSQHPNRTPT